MTKQSMLLGLAGLALIGVMVAPKAIFAYKGDPNVKGPNYTIERHDAMEKAFETGDYNTWKSLMSGRGRVAQVINASNFSKFAEAHELAEKGKIAEANAIRSELGLSNGSGRGQGTGCGMNR